ncbi:hypothetical protein V1478_011636 [Vespula squamosa]|uniref:Uncharacterized protein n=1 Tax=Vespula squamosa TaxID=30214 RepID=A0ABD2AF23_VESSQ
MHIFAILNLYCHVFCIIILCIGNKTIFTLTSFHLHIELYIYISSHQLCDRLNVVINICDCASTIAALIVNCNSCFVYEIMIIIICSIKYCEKIYWSYECALYYSSVIILLYILNQAGNFRRYTCIYDIFNII